MMRACLAGMPSEPLPLRIGTATAMPSIILGEPVFDDEVSCLP